MRPSRLLSTIAAMSASALLAGCGQTSASAHTGDRSRAEASASASPAETEPDGTIHKVAEDARVVGARVEKGTLYVGAKVAEGARVVSREVRDDVRGMSVLAALKADNGIDTRHIDVDVSADRRTVTLRGTVPTSEQKEAAGRIAATKIPGYRMRNFLMVAED